MKSLYDLEKTVINFLRNTKNKGRFSLYDCLVKSSIKMEGIGSDGFLMMKVQVFTESLLEDLTDTNLIKLWEEIRNCQSDNSTTSVAKDRNIMIYDIYVDNLQRIAKRICTEAEKYL
jgi:hypothetical protein